MVIPEDAEVRVRQEPSISESYDESVEYIPRSERKEWSAVGMMGKLALRKGEPTGDRWIKLKDISDTVEMWLVK